MAYKFKEVKIADKIFSVLNLISGVLLLLIAVAGIGFGFLAQSFEVAGLGIIAILLGLYYISVSYILWNLEKRRKGIVYTIFTILSVLALITNVLNVDVIGIVLSGYITARLFKVIMPK